MSDCFLKARELGELILKSEESINLADARAVFNEDKDAVAKLELYNNLQTSMREKISKKEISQDEIQTTSEKLTEMATELKQDPIIGALVFAENDYNTFVNDVMNVVRLTITGVSRDSGGCSSSGGCGGCSGCH